MQAYKDYVSAHPTTVNNRLLPALTKYSPDQLYFIAWAQVGKYYSVRPSLINGAIFMVKNVVFTSLIIIQLWCAIYTEEGFSVAAKESHSPSPFRYNNYNYVFPDLAGTCHTIYSILVELSALLSTAQSLLKHLAVQADQR